MSSPLENPYVGPRTFTEEDKYFFGRDQEARDLLALIAAEKLVLFYAQSGAGKSSLLNVKIAPGLRKRGFEVLPVSRVSGELPAGISPDEVANIFSFNLLLSLNHELPPELKKTTRTLTGQRLADFLQAEDAPLPDDGGQYYYELVPYVLIIDQFEELMTHHPDRWPERAGFFEQLQEAMARHPNLWVVLSMREDYVTTLDPYSQYLANRLRARFYMQQLGRPAALEAIKKPAEGGGRPFAAGVAEALVDNLRHIQVYGQTEPRPGQYVEPVQLQVVCYRLWENLDQKAGSMDKITAGDVQASGDVDAALAQFYEQALAEAGRQTGVSEMALRDWFEGHLITEAGTRDMVYQGETETVGLPNAAVAALADQFLLRAEIRAGGTWYELVHDRFVEPIRQANQRWRERQPLIQVAQAWVDSGRSNGRLLEGLPLQEALDSNWQALGPLVAEFLEAGQRLQEQKEAALRAEKEAQQARELAAARRLAEEQAARAREQAQAAAKSRRLATWLAVVGAMAVILAIVAAVFGIRANQSATAANIEREVAVTAQAEAEVARATAEAARQEIAQQNEAAEAEIQFSQTTDPEAWLTHLITLFDFDRGSVARQLFWELPEVYQTELLTAEDERLVRVIKELYVNLADVNRTGYADRFLEAMSEGLAKLQETNREAKDLKAEIDQWRQARKLASGGQYEDAKTEYNKLIALNGNNPAARYERAGVLAELGEYEAALADLERVMALVGENGAFAGGRLVEGGSEFATTEQARQAIRRLIYWVSEPEMASLFERSRASYPNLDPAGLTPTSLITDSEGVKMVLVEGGLFDMGSNQGASDERPVHKVALADFYIDQYEVTTAQYKACEDDGVCTPPWETGSSSREDYYGNEDYDHYPVIYVDWYQARRYCEWRGGRLPTEAQWEKAPRGTDGRTYPWGEDISCDLANYWGCAVEDTAPVGSYPAGVSPYGAYDMAGNVWEWVQSEYRDYPYRADDGREGLDSTNVRVLRGGGWGSRGAFVRAAYRGHGLPGGRYDGSVGFRCVVAPGVGF